VSDESEQGMEPGSLLSLWKPFQAITTTLRMVAIAFVALAFVVSARDEWLAPLGLGDFRRDHLPWLGGGLVVTSASLLIAILWSVGPLANRWWEELRLEAKVRERLKKLAPDEKKVFQLYKDGKTRSQYFYPWDGVVLGLMNEGLLYRPTLGGLDLFRGDKFPFNIQPWVWDYLDKHPDLLGLDEPATEEGHARPDEPQVGPPLPK